MKKLRSFLRFEIESFLKDKELRIVGAEPWQTYNDGVAGEVIGTKYKLVIATDNTVYNPTDPTRDARINEGEPLTVKINQPQKSYKKFAIVRLIDAEATVYGEFQNELSVTAKDIEFINTQRE